MTTKYKLALIPEGYRVVPEGFVSKVESSHRTTNIVAKEILVDEAIEILKAAPQLTTPPVLRWEGDYLKVGNIPIAIVDEFRGDFAWSCQRDEGSAKSLEEARCAAEKALGLPIVEEV